MKLKEIRRRKSQDLYLELTPLIDVVFLLLIFFMVSTTFVDINSGINVNLPDSEVREELRSNDEIIVTVRANGTVNVSGVEGNIEFDNLKNVISGRLEKLEKQSVVLKGDEETLYRDYVRVMEECRLAGAVQIDIATETIE